MNHDSKKFRVNRWLVGVGGAFVLPPVVLSLAIRASEQAGDKAVLPCLALGLAFIWITPFHVVERVVLSVLYLVVMAIVLFAVGAMAMCGYHHACL